MQIFLTRLTQKAVQISEQTTLLQGRQRKRELTVWRIRLKLSVN